MPPSSRSWTAAALVAAAVVCAAAVASPDEIAQRKRDIVRTAVETQGGRAADAALLQAADRAAALVDIRCSVESRYGAVTLVTSGPVEYRSFVMDDGRRIVVDLSDTVNFMSGVIVPPNGNSFVTRVRTSLFKLEPNLVSRVVIETPRKTVPDIRTINGGLQVRLTPVNAPAPSRPDPASVETRLAALHSQIDAQREAHSAHAAEMGTLLDEARSSVSSALYGWQAAVLDERALALEAELRAVASGQPGAGGAGGTFEESALHEHRSEIKAQLVQAQSELAKACGEIERMLEEFGAEASKLTDTLRLSAGDEAAARETTDSLERIEKEAGALERVIAEQVEAALNQLEGRIQERLAHIASLEQHARERAEEAAARVAHARRQAETVPAVANVRAEHRFEQAAGQDAQGAGGDDIDLRLAELNAAIDAVAAAQFELTQPVFLPLAAVGDEIDEGEAAANGVEVNEAETVDLDPETVENMRGMLEGLMPADAEPGEQPAPAPGVEPPPVPEQRTPQIITPAMPPEEIEQITAPRRRPPEAFEGDPLAMPVTIEFREMDLSQVVAILAQKAGINVIAGVELTGSTSASMHNVPLRQAMEQVLRLHNLGFVEEAGIYRIVSYQEAVEARRVTRTVYLDNAQAQEIRNTLDGVIVGTPDQTYTTIAANDSANVVIIAGPVNRVEELVALATQLDMADQALPTVTHAIKLNHADPLELVTMVQGSLTDDVGSVVAEPRSRQLVVTDYPVVVEQVRKLIEDVDLPVKQVAIEAMIVDAVMRDASQTGIDWTLNLIRRRNQRGDVVGNLQSLSFDGNLGSAIGTESLNAGILNIATLSRDVGINAIIAAEVASRNAEILARPVVTTVENQPAIIDITQEFPYQEITQSTTGPPIASTAFKPIGVQLEVTPRVTHTNEIISNVKVKQSSISGITETGVPIEDKREAETTIRLVDGRTVFIGGLRNISDRMELSKIPLLGDIPVLNVLFRNTDVEKIHTELLLFLTCHVMEPELPELSPREQDAYLKMGDVPDVPNSERTLYRSIVRPGEIRDPAWKFRRPE